MYSSVEASNIFSTVTFGVAKFAANSLFRSMFSLMKVETSCNCLFFSAEVRFKTSGRVTLCCRTVALMTSIVSEKETATL